jgi:hypothetical protein
MKFNGNPSADLGLEYHTFSETERDGKTVVRYTLSTPVDSEKEAELSKYENVKLVRNGASHKYAPEIKYDILYVAEDPDYEEPEENNPTADYLRADEEIEDDEINEKLNCEIIGVDVDETTFENVSKYASVTSAMAEVNNQILLYKSMASQFPEDSQLFENLISECEVQLGKLSSLVSTPETSENMEKGLEEGRVLSGEITANESFEDEHLGDIGEVDEINWDEDDRFSKMRDLVFDKVNNSKVLSEEDKKGFFEEIKFESLAEFLGFYEGEFDPVEVLSSPEKMEEIANDYLAYLENPENGFIQEG